MGLKFILIGSIFILITGGVISLIILLRNNGFSYTSNLVFSSIRTLFTGKTKYMKQSIVKRPNNYYPYTIAITMGSVATIWYMYPIN